MKRNKSLLAAFVFGALFAGLFGVHGAGASGTTFPSINTMGSGHNLTPISAFQVPNNIPAADLPTPGGSSVGIMSAIQSYSSSQGTPTSAQPNCQEPPASAQYQLNQYYWPTVAQSIAWWESQPGIPAAGTYAYQVGSTTSHQDQEGWAGSCVVSPPPCTSSGPGWTSPTWGGQFVGWTGGCTFTPQPPCSGTGYISTYAWNGSAWTGACVYAAPPICPVGYIDTYSWNGSTWSGSCTQPRQPVCPVGYTGSYTWGGASGWVDNCVPPQPVCPAGYTGGYTWSGSTWVDGCTQPPQPVCPAGETGSYTWGGASGWVNGCAATSCPAGYAGTPATGCQQLCAVMVVGQSYTCSLPSGHQGCPVPGAGANADGWTYATTCANAQMLPGAHYLGVHYGNGGGQDMLNSNANQAFAASIGTVLGSLSTPRIATYLASFTFNPGYLQGISSMEGGCCAYAQEAYWLTPLPTYYAGWYSNSSASFSGNFTGFICNSVATDSTGTFPYCPSITFTPLPTTTPIGRDTQYTTMTYSVTNGVVTTSASYSCTVVVGGGRSESSYTRSGKCP